MFLVFKIIAFEPWSTNSDNIEEDTWHWQSICYQATVRVIMSLKEIFSKSGSLRVMKKEDDYGVMKILQEFQTV